MIELVIVYCLSADLARCTEVREALADYPTTAACARAAEFVAQRYLQAHPKWQMKRWRCEIDQPRQEPVSLRQPIANTAGAAATVHWGPFMGWRFLQAVLPPR